jgi:hypothetical protein
MNHSRRNAQQARAGIFPMWPDRYMSWTGFVTVVFGSIPDGRKAAKAVQSVSFPFV